MSIEGQRPIPNRNDRPPNSFSMRFDIITIFPDLFTGPFDYGILKRARTSGLVDIGLHDLRGFTHDRHRTVDDRPFGGGEGMVLKAQPIYDAVTSLNLSAKAERQRRKETVILLSAQGQPFTQSLAQELAMTERVVIICGRYEGVDERVNQLLCDREISIGDYVLSGGELAAAVIVDAVVRLLPGALGNPDSSRFESFGADDAAEDDGDGTGPPRSTYGSGGLLDYPHYTRPAEFMGMGIPDALSGGNHEVVRRWRRRMALAKTLQNRPDLLDGITFSDEDREILDELRREGAKNLSETKGWD
jgi:tRNA (guanine37-N1)-methyltransferase